MRLFGRGALKSGGAGALCAALEAGGLINKPSLSDRFANFWVETPQNLANSPRFGPKFVLCLLGRHRTSLNNFKKRIQRDILRLQQTRSSFVCYNHPRGHPRWYRQQKLRTFRVIYRKICAYGPSCASLCRLKSSWLCALPRRGGYLDLD